MLRWLFSRLITSLTQLPANIQILHNHALENLIMVVASKFKLVVGFVHFMHAGAGHVCEQGPGVAVGHTIDVV